MIKIIVDKISKKLLTQLCKQYFKHFVKFVEELKIKDEIRRIVELKLLSPDEQIKLDE